LPAGRYSGISSKGIGYRKLTSIGMEVFNRWNGEFAMKNKIQFTRKRLVIVIVILILLFGIIFREKLIQTYVVVAREQLATYAENLLDNNDRQNDRYGFWKVRSYPEEQMVEFHTGGFGLAPSSTYKGFYYAAENVHKVFSVADKSLVTMEIDGDLATWTDGTDNNGTSMRINDNWFWYEASF